VERSLTLSEILKVAGDALRNSMYHAMPGSVVAYHAGEQTADVQPMVNDVRFDLDTGARTSEPWQVIPHVPVAFPKMGGLAVYCDLAAGDQVLLFAQDLDPTAYRQTAQRSDPGDVARHAGSYWTAHPADMTAAGALPATGGVIVAGDPNGTLQPVALAATIDALISVLVATYTPSGTETGFAALVAALVTFKATHWTASTTTGASKLKSSV
jgi:hypothetical protein